MVKSDLFGTKHTKFYLVAEQATVGAKDIVIRIRLCLEECQRSKLQVTVKLRDTAENSYESMEARSISSKEGLFCRLCIVRKSKVNTQCFTLFLSFLFFRIVTQ